MTTNRAKKYATKLMILFGPNGEHWGRYGLAKTKRGDYVDPKHPGAERYCLMGGCYKLGIPQDWLFQAIREKTDGIYTGVASFNDDHKFVSIKRLLCGIINPKGKETAA